MTTAATPALVHRARTVRARGGHRRVMLVLQSTAVGGMETHCVDLAAEFAARGMDVTAVVPEDAVFDRLAARFSHASVIRCTTDARAGRLAQFRSLGRLFRSILREQPAALHLHIGGATGGAGVAFIARAARIPAVVVTEHDIPRAGPSVWERLQRVVFDALVDAQVSVSRRNAKLRRERLGSHGRRAVVLNGVPLDPAAAGERAANRKRVRAELALDPRDVVVGTVVRLASGKGLDDLMEAMALVQEQASLHLLLVGDGPLREQLQAQARQLEIASRVRFAGHQPTPAPYLDAMDMFVLPVPSGSMSIGLLEAMARGVPSIITFGGPEEAVVDGVSGLTAPPNDPRALAQAIGKLACDPPLRRSLGEAGKAHVERAYSVERVADDLITVYRCRRSPLPARLLADEADMNLPRA